MTNLYKKAKKTASGVAKTVKSAVPKPVVNKPFVQKDRPIADMRRKGTLPTVKPTVPKRKK